MILKRFSTLPLFAVALFALVFISSSQAQTNEKPQTAPPRYPNYPSETPDNLKPATATFDHERREVMIPMRDGVLARCDGVHYNRELNEPLTFCSRADIFCHR